MRIMFIIPFPFDEEGLANRAAQIPRGILNPDTAVDCMPVRNAAVVDDSYYERLIFDMYMTEAGVSAEEDGYDAVAVDTVSDCALYPLRSRLSIPVLGPGLVAYHVAAMLGKKFSILTMWDKWLHLYETNLTQYNLWPMCASIRHIDTPPDVESLFGEREQEIVERLTHEAELAIAEDGAEVIILGATTMHAAGDHMTEHLDVPVVNPGPVVLKMAETIVQLGLSHSKIGFPTPGLIQDEKFQSLMPR